MFVKKIKCFIIIKLIYVRKYTIPTLNLWKIKEISGNWCQNSASVNYHIKLVNQDHKIEIKISYFIKKFLLLFLHNLYMFVNKKNKYDINLWEIKRITGDQIPDSAFNSAVNYLFLLTGAHKIGNKWIICLTFFKFWSFITLRNVSRYKIQNLTPIHKELRNDKRLKSRLGSQLSFSNYHF